MTTGHQCMLCFQEFSQKKDLKAHEPICGLMYESKQERKRGIRRDEEHENDITCKTTLTELICIVRTLARKNSELEKKVAGLEKWVNTKKKRIKPEDWLSKQILPHKSWGQWIIKRIRVSDEQWEDFINKDLSSLELVQAILSNGLNKGKPEYEAVNEEDEEEDNEEGKEKHKAIPICAFDKPNEIYIYARNKEKEGVWRKMEQAEFCKLLAFIQKSICGKYIAWSKENKMDSKTTNQVMQSLSEIPSDESSAGYLKVFGTMYQCVKQEFKSLIEFEIG